jgi:hypothetical protein
MPNERSNITFKKIIAASYSIDIVHVTEANKKTGPQSGPVDPDWPAFAYQ